MGAREHQNKRLYNITKLKDEPFYWGEEGTKLRLFTRTKLRKVEWFHQGERAPIEKPLSITKIREINNFFLGVGQIKLVFQYTKMKRDELF